MDEDVALTDGTVQVPVIPVNGAGDVIAYPDQFEDAQPGKDDEPPPPPP